jgi:D-alanine-D-alanine ligase
MEQVRQMARDAYQILCLSGLTRIDFFLDKHTDCFYLNEVNTLPGFTSISMYPMLWQHDGLGYKELLQRLVELAFERAALKGRIKTEK